MASYNGVLENKAVCDIDRSRMERFKDDFGFEKGYLDWMSLLKDPGVDIVSLCVPASKRLEIIKPAAELGKHIFVEKPLAWNLEEAVESVETCEKHGVKLAVADQYRFFPQIITIADLMRKNIIGRPFAGLMEVMVFYDFPPYPGQERGFVVEMVTHNIDLLRYIMDEDVVQVYSRMGKSPSRRQDDAREFWNAMTLTFESGCVVQFFNSWDCLGFETPSGRPEGRLHLECEKGTVFLNKDDDTLLMVYSTDLNGWLKPRITPELKKQDVEAYGTGESMRKFVNSVENNVMHPVSGREYLKTLKVTFAAYDSSESGEVVKLIE